MKKGSVIIVSGPSGVGKGTIIRAVIAKMPNIKLAVSACTRKPRPGEKDGVDYYFLDNASFSEKVQNNEFLEWCEVHGNRYGTLKSEVDDAVSKGNDIILEIDIQGAEKIRNKLNRRVSIFITPPSFEDLIQRLYNRNTDQPDVIKQRVLMAGHELAAIGEYDYIVVNNDINTAVEDITNIIKRFKDDFIG